ncbi:MAG: DNA repair protein RadA [Lachnospiraceae bacterium]|nr:DNA repair protein RadA [Lachnospiraceae bacterium]
MAKAKTVFFCKECGYESGKWLGQCPGCRNWDTMVEGKSVTKGTTAPKTYRTPAGGSQGVVSLSKVEFRKNERLETGIGELDRVLGGGIVPGSLVLVGGDPGIGKSTLLLQMCKELANKEKKVLYISGEESCEQIKMRADRIEDFKGDLLLLSETNLTLIEEIAGEIKPEILIIDSIQTMYKEDVSGSPGSISQVRESTSVLMHIAKILGITVFIVGHVTKEGNVAGPRLLEHMVDTVLYFEGENHASYRMLRAVKNRFGSTNEVGVFEMKQTGLSEVTNPSEYMLQGKPVNEPGSVVTCTMEGTRPILVEIQALVCRTSFNFPRRTVAGADFNRLNILMAVLEKRMGLKMAECDAYVNVAGGMKLNETSIDLSVVAAIVSSYFNKEIDEKTIIFGEVGLTGEVRAVSNANTRVLEAEKMGFNRVILPAANLKGLPEVKLKLCPIKSVREFGQYLN